MNYKVIIQPEAEAELRETADYIEKYNPLKAIEVVDSLVEYFTNTLSEFPKVGVKYSPKVRKLAHKKHTAFYTVNEQLEEAIYIAHCRPYKTT